MTSVLVFYRDAEWYGGVVNFVASLRKSIGEEIEYSQFRIGRRKGRVGVLLRLMTPVFDSVRLAILLVHRRYDAYHINPSLNISSLLRDGLFMLVLRMMRAKNVIVSFHGWDDSVEKSISQSKILRLLFRAVFGYANNTLVLAEDFEKWLVGIGFDDSRVHHYTTMFDSEEFEGVRIVAQRDDFRILFLSRLVREKGIYELVEAFASLIKDYPSLNLDIAGNGPEEESLKKHVNDSGLKDKVRFVGYVRGTDKVKVFAEAGMFVFPTYYGEGCPISLLEAMAAGLPLVTTRAGGISHIIRHEENGLLLDEVTPAAIEAAIRRLLDNMELREVMSRTNASEAWEKYSASVVAQQFEQFYGGTGGA